MTTAPPAPGQSLPKVRIYTDGGCRPNPGPGGWGAVLVFPGGEVRELSGREDGATNNRMELTAAIKALESLPSPHEVELVTDSEYLRQGITRWLPAWRARGWLTAAKKPVKNQDLWRALDGEISRHRVVWRWTKGHAGDRWNERADRLAAAAIGRPGLPLDDAGAVHLFTGVAHSAKQDVGAWGVVLRFKDAEKEASGAVAGASANRMHIVSAIEGLRLIRRPARVHVYTVSSYLKDGATVWIRGWKARDFTTRDGKPVRHRRLWLELESLLARHHARWHVVGGEEVPEPMTRAKALARAALAGRDAPA